MTPSIEYASYLVRLWCEVGADGTREAADWHGEVEHIQTGERWTFDTLDEVLELLRREAEDPDIVRSETEGQGW